MRLPDDLDPNGPDLTVRQLADKLEKSERTVYRWLQEKKFQGAYNIGTWCIPQQSVIAYLNRVSIPVEPLE